MPCYKPLKGWKMNNGKLRTKRLPYDPDPMVLPCGGCIGCKIDRSRSWAVRCVHEAQMHTANSFITLTYSPEHLPSDGSLNLKHLQEFIQRLRNANRDNPIRYFACGEYGEKLERPHYHAIIFGFDFPDRVLYSVYRQNKNYRSDLLEKLWPYGHSMIGTVTFQSAAYVARYIMKKINGPDQEDHYLTKPDEHGEVKKLKPEFTTQSRKPGIGASWYAKYKNDVYPSDEVIIEGKRYPVPRYYDKLLERENPQLLNELKKKREEFSQLNPDNQTPRRLADREKFKEQQLTHLNRGLEK